MFYCYPESLTSQLPANSQGHAETFWFFSCQGYCSFQMRCVYAGCFSFSSFSSHRRKERCQGC